ncbi:cytochrome b561 [Devosia enhydra]|uniref:Cytochrome b561 n=1 Tax=Devosia enhydra TaxID=665118 RepID=A0A1K2I359_9HYPH|nr:cytochrome b/b6 domain-containing protein [Devosia enhydra]SFZ86822.1 cytochrome b561 [Devosia enhydra]
MARRLGYSRLQIALHWIIAALVIYQLFIHPGIEAAFDAGIDGTVAAPADASGAQVHVIIGITILVLAIARLLIRVTRGAPAPHHDKPAALVWLGLATHWALYAIILIMPISGAVAWFRGVEEAADFHGTISTLIYVLVGLHVIGALAEHFYFKNDSLKRMLRAKS